MSDLYQDKYVVTSIFIIEIISKHLFATLRNMASSVVKLRWSWSDAVSRSSSISRSLSCNLVNNILDNLINLALLLLQNIISENQDGQSQQKYLPKVAENVVIALVYTLAHLRSETIMIFCKVGQFYKSLKCTMFQHFQHNRIAMS